MYPSRIVLLQALSDHVTTFLSFSRIVHARIAKENFMPSSLRCLRIRDLIVFLPLPPFDRQSNLEKHRRACKSGRRFMLIH